MHDIDVLKNYRCATLEIKLLERQLERFSTIGGPDGYANCSLDRISKGTNNREAAALQRAEGFISILEKKKSELCMLTERFEEIMSRVLYPRTRLILRGYYALGMTDEAIAEELNMSTRHVNSQRNQFIRSLEDPKAA